MQTIYERKISCFKNCHMLNFVVHSVSYFAVRMLVITYLLKFASVFPLNNLLNKDIRKLLIVDRLIIIYI